MANLFNVPRETPKPPPFDFPQGFAGGMNISVTADQISINQSPDMLNMNYDNGGVPGKRYGFTRVNADSWGATPIRGMTLFFQVLQPEPVLVVAHGGKLWSVDKAAGERIDLMTGTKATITDAQTNFFTMGNRLYAYNGTDYVYWDGVNPVRDVVKVAYIPLFTLAGSKDAPGVINEPLNYLSDSWIDSFSPDGTATTFPVSFVPSEIVTAEEDTPTGVKTYTEGINLTVDRTISDSKPFATVTFATAPIKGTDTLRIKCTKTGLMDKGRILNNTMHVVFGGKADTRVHFAGHPEYINVRYSSGLEDPTYWPEEAWEPVGADNEAITGFGKVADTLFTFKERSRFYTYIEGPDDAGRITFPTLAVNDQYGCVAPGTVWTAQDGLLALSEEGVTWSTTSTFRGQFNTKMISKNINGKNGIAKGILDHSKEERKKAHAIVLDDKYFLHIGDMVYVLDLKYSNLASEVYCWYPYSGVPGKASQFLSIDSDPWISDKSTGLVYKPQKRYLDDGQFIDAYWTTPLIFAGSRDWIKKFDRLNITFAGQPEGDHSLTIITDQGMEDILLLVETQGVFDFGNLDFGNFAFGVPFYPGSQGEKVGYKGEYLQWKLRNNKPDQGITILAQSLQFSLRKRVK